MITTAKSPSKSNSPDVLPVPAGGKGVGTGGGGVLVGDGVYGVLVAVGTIGVFVEVGGAIASGVWVKVGDGVGVGSSTNRAVTNWPG
jgi:hypothetical protein